MRKWTRWRIAGVAAIAMYGHSPTASAASPHFSIDTLADGVYAFIRQEPLGFEGGRCRFITDRTTP